MKVTIKIALGLVFLLLGLYYIWPRFIISSGPLGYKAVDSYSKGYYINCEIDTLYKKDGAGMSIMDREWIENNLENIYKISLLEFDTNGDALKIISAPHWVNSFIYNYSIFNEDGILTDTYESIIKINGIYYRFDYTLIPGEVEKGRLSSYPPTKRKTDYSYGFYVNLAKKSSSHPQ